MEPSSLVFVAIIGVWAAYLVPHWLRRREELAQSRTRDRFSVGLRVLQRRRRPARSTHRSGDAVLTSPRVVVDADGELLYIPADRALLARAQREAAASRAATADSTAAAAPDCVVQPDRVADAERAAEPAAQIPRDLETAMHTARTAAIRRARIMAVLLVASVSSWAVASVSALPTWAAAPASGLLVLHTLASRSAGLRSRESLTVLAAQLYAAELAKARPKRQAAATRHPAATTATGTPERVARRAAAVGAETWEPVPVPPPTYTLKPAVHRPEPAPLDLPAAAHTATPAAGVSRGALPRTAADIERILALDSDLDSLFEHRKAVNG